MVKRERKVRNKFMMYQHEGFHLFYITLQQNDDNKDAIDRDIKIIKNKRYYIRQARSTNMHHRVFVSPRPHLHEPACQPPAYQNRTVNMQKSREKMTQQLSRHDVDPHEFKPMRYM